MPLPLNAPLPEWDGAAEWINGRADRESLRGKPVLVHFWSVSCRLCTEGLGLLEFLQDIRGKAIGLELVGVHIPRSARDADLETVREAVREHGLRHPVLADQRLTVAGAFRNEYVPTYYLFDDTHRLRHVLAGEHALRMLERRLGEMASGG